MIFNSFNFIVFYPLLFLLYYSIPIRYGKLRNLFLLLVSYLLYIQWEPVYALILMGVTLVTYCFALLISNKRQSKCLMIIGVLLSLFPLTFFKYFNFINENISEILMMFGFSCRLDGLNWAIPIGISFYTFQALSYLLDVYYKRQKVERNFLHYALFVSFFPCILSGPINKASLIIPQIKQLRPYFDYSKVIEGMRMLLWGMFMKVVVADRVALYVDTVLPHYENYSGLTCFVASLLYTIQIYADFAGYSLMAIGVGKTLGFELTENFRRPYFAVSVTDFWHRWHISLSTWLKDYIYIPLGGSRCSKIRNYWNILLTFLVSGIWHGANWTFIVWGGVHGIFQIIEKILGQEKCKYGSLGKSIKIIITFLLVNFAWIIFRMSSISEAWGVITRIFNYSLPLSLYLPEENTTNASIIIGLFLLITKDIIDEFYSVRIKIFDNSSMIFRWFFYYAIIIIILLIGVFGADQFIYAYF